jgi:hypothetical protein
MNSIADSRNCASVVLDFLPCLLQTYLSYCSTLYNTASWAGRYHAKVDSLSLHFHFPIRVSPLSVASTLKLLSLAPFCSSTIINYSTAITLLLRQRILLSLHTKLSTRTSKMPSFSNILRSVKNPATTPSETLKTAIKKVKIPNNRSDIRMMSAISQTASKPTAPSIKQPSIGATAKALTKKRKADDTDTTAVSSTAKKSKTKMQVVEDEHELHPLTRNRNMFSPKLKKLVKQNEHHNAVLSYAKGDELEDPLCRRNQADAEDLKSWSLERMTKDALDKLQERHFVAKIALDGLMPLVKKNKAVETAVAVLEQQIDDCDLSIQNLRSFGCSLESGETKSVDSHILLALAGSSCDNSLRTETTKPIHSQETQPGAEVEVPRFSDATLAAIFGPDEEIEKSCEER